jgi:hypothetical protein
MESVIEHVGAAVVGDVLQETVDELSGRSKRKWAVILVAFVIGAVAAALVIRSRKRGAVDPAKSLDEETMIATDSEDQG